MVFQLEHSRVLQEYQILWNFITTYWIALAVGLILAYITEKLIFNVFFVGVISISALITLVILFQLTNLKDRLDEIEEGFMA